MDFVYASLLSGAFKLYAKNEQSPGRIGDTTVFVTAATNFITTADVNYDSRIAAISYCYFAPTVQT